MIPAIALAAFFGATSVLAVKCSLENKCPESAPCCGQFGDCGVGAFCLGGCDPRMSFALESCVPSPTCKDKSLKMDTLDNIQHISEYLGDPSKADWIASGEPALRDSKVLLTMPKNSVGTVLSSSTYLWYGNVKARMKTSRGRGVVTAFILFSDVKDEIDYEWVGVDLEVAQTNFYYQGIPNYENSENVTELSNTFFNFHDYEINWTPDKIEFIVDGQVERSIDKQATWNETANQYDYPQTPARVQLSLWPGGAESNAKGTVDWAGGLIDWEHEDIQNVGYFYATAESVDIKCWDGSGRLGSNDGVSYRYNDLRGTNDTVVVGDAKTTIASLQATGSDPNKGAPKPDEDDDNDNDNNDDDDDDEDEVASVPGGIIYQPPREGDDDDSGSSSSGGSANEGPSNGVSPDGTPDTTGCDTSSFHSDCGSGEEVNTGSGDSGSSKASASALAIIIAGFALYWL
jgi:beta-glucanase (GH16 family)